MKCARFVAACATLTIGGAAHGQAQSDAPPATSLQPTVALRAGHSDFGNIVGAAVGINRGWLDLDLELSRTSDSDTDYEDWQVGVRVGAELFRTSRFRAYAFGRLFASRRTRPTARETLVQDNGYGYEAGLGAAAKLSEFAELYSEYTLGRRRSDDDTVRATLALGLRFRNW